MRYCQFDSYFPWPLVVLGLLCCASGFLLHALPRVSFLALIFIFFDPCAGRHLPSLLRPPPKKVSKERRLTPQPPNCPPRKQTCQWSDTFIAPAPQPVFEHRPLRPPPPTRFASSAQSLFSTVGVLGCRGSLLSGLFVGLFRGSPIWLLARPVGRYLFARLSEICAAPVSPVAGRFLPFPPRRPVLPASGGCGAPRKVR
jgi:hypothetical protein